jgi:hypothetical protein
VLGFSGCHVMVGHENGPRRLTDLIVENAEQDMKAFLAEAALPAGVEHGVLTVPPR